MARNKWLTKRRKQEIAKENPTSKFIKQLGAKAETFNENKRSLRPAEEKLFNSWLVLLEETADHFTDLSTSWRSTRASTHPPGLYTILTTTIPWGDLLHWLHAGCSDPLLSLNLQLFQQPRFRSTHSKHLYRLRRPRLGLRCHHLQHSSRRLANLQSQLGTA